MFYAITKRNDNAFFRGQSMISYSKYMKINLRAIKNKPQPLNMGNVLVKLVKVYSKSHSYIMHPLHIHTHFFSQFSIQCVNFFFLQHIAEVYFNHLCFEVKKLNGHDNLASLRNSVYRGFTHSVARQVKLKLFPFKEFKEFIKRAEGAYQVTFMVISLIVQGKCALRTLRFI